MFPPAKKYPTMASVHVRRESVEPPFRRSRARIIVRQWTGFYLTALAKPPGGHVESEFVDAEYDRGEPSLSELRRRRHSPSSPGFCRTLCFVACGTCALEPDNAMI